MSIRDFYLICHTCKERVFIASERATGKELPNSEITDFVIEHGIYHDVRLGDEETEYEEE